MIFLRHPGRRRGRLLVTSPGADVYDEDRLRADAAAHLWLNFTPLPAASQPGTPLIVRGDGCYVTDAAGRRYLDGLAGMFCVNVGHGRGEIAQAAAAQAAQLGYWHSWGSLHPPAIELATTISRLAGGDLNRVFFTSGGSEAVESALKLARDYHLARGDERRTKIIARDHAYHGTTLGALRATGIKDLRGHFEPLISAGGHHVPATNAYRAPDGFDPGSWAEAIAELIEAEDPETVAAVILEPVQNNGGCLVPPDGYFARVREICDAAGVLLISDEVICAWGRTGEFFGHQHFGYAPDIVTTAKGITSAYAPMGAVIASDKVAAPFLDGDHLYAHGFTFGAHPLSAAVALANIAIIENEALCDRVQDKAAEFRATLDSLSDIPVVGDVRGAGYFLSIELVRDQRTKERFSPAENEELGAGLLPRLLREAGLLTRVDTRQGTPIITFSPPLIAGPEQFAEIEAALRPALTAVAAQLAR
jgi:adenosylmethionine-8-amino-7-oxononanoate aminotransferase